LIRIAQVLSSNATSTTSIVTQNANARDTVYSTQFADDDDEDYDESSSECECARVIALRVVTSARQTTRRAWRRYCTRRAARLPIPTPARRSQH
jgi:hypothetical protein